MQRTLNDGEKLLIAIKGRMLPPTSERYNAMIGGEIIHYIETLSKEEIIRMIDEIDDEGYYKHRGK